MTLSPGTQLGPYTVIAPLGAGGMGEVYRARDTRLEREVAIKLLPAALSGDREALRRIEQEARALAALNHPGLLTIFDFGATTAGAPYLVCELLQGETLRERLRAGALPVREAIAAGAAIARGLAAAHSQGIVHRDLKPENIFCTSDGRMKILDFGLAKLNPALGDDARTQAAAGTQAGVVLGTLGYMAPEQARGQAADARTDLFSLGSVLYEMLSGRAAFQGPTPADTISAILREEPPELTLANASLAAPLDRIVRHCLEKNPARRFQSADDLGFALESVGAAHSTTSLQAAVAAEARPSRRRLLFAAVGTLGLALAAAAGWWLQARTNPASVAAFDRLTFSQGQIARALFLPDGRTVAATGILGNQTQWQPFTTRLDSPGLQPLGTTFDTLLAVAGGTAAVLLHSRALSGFERVGTLALTPLSGGSPRPMLGNIEDAAFAPAAEAVGDQPPLLIVRYHPASQIRTLEFPPGKVLVQNNGWYSSPRFSRDGKLIAVLEHSQPGDDSGEVLVLDRSGRVRLRGPHFGSTQSLAWSPDGREVWYAAAAHGESRGLYALSLAGRNRILLAGPTDYFLEDVLASGEVLLRGDTARLGALAVTPQHPAPRDFTVLDWANSGAVSADGKYFLVGDETAGPDYATFLVTADGAPPVRLGPGDAQDISSDDQWGLSRDTQNQLWLLPLGAGSPRQLTHSNLIWLHARFVPGQQALVGVGNEPGHDARSYLIGWDGQAKPLTPEGTTGDRVTPDGKFVFASGPGGAALYPLDGGAPRPLREKLDSLSTGVPIRFGLDDATLFIERSTGPGAQVLHLDLASGSEQPMFTLAAPGQAGVAAVGIMGMSADGQSYLYLLQTNLSTLYVVRGLH